MKAALRISIKPFPARDFNQTVNSTEANSILAAKNKAVIGRKLARELLRFASSLLRRKRIAGVKSGRVAYPLHGAPLRFLVQFLQPRSQCHRQTKAPTPAKTPCAPLSCQISRSGWRFIPIRALSG